MNINRTTKVYTEGGVNVSINMSTTLYHELQEDHILRLEDEMRGKNPKISFIGLGMESCSIISKFVVNKDRQDGWYVIGNEPDDKSRTEILWSSKVIADRAFDLDGVYDIASKPRVDRHGNSIRKSCIFVVYLENAEEDVINDTVKQLYEIIEISDIIIDKYNEKIIIKNMEKMEIPFDILKFVIGDDQKNLPLPDSAFNGNYGAEVKPIIIASH